jgi:hypothetical protein
MGDNLKKPVEFTVEHGVPIKVKVTALDGSRWLLTLATSVFEVVQLEGITRDDGRPMFEVSANTSILVKESGSET